MPCAGGCGCQTVIGKSAVYAKLPRQCIRAIIISIFFGSAFDTSIGKARNTILILQLIALDRYNNIRTISYNIVTVKGTAASRVFCRLKAEAVEWESKWPDAITLG